MSDGSKDRFEIGSRCIIAADVELRGDITIGAASGPIVIGNNNIIEEQVIIVNRSKSLMQIGSDNHFQVASRIESPRVGSHNVFDIKSRTSFNVSIGSHCHIGAGCLVLPSPFPPAFVAGGPRSPIPPPLPPKDQSERGDSEGDHDDDDDEMAATEPSATSVATDSLAFDADNVAVETLPDYTQVYSSDNKRRTWSGEGSAQARALHAKHLAYLRETLPRYHKLKMFI
ncbi:hypothetical protein OIO90_005554 [Microbotryomycetes sp. JL221]|nr:hypothetical protein OIO90_005554 [Microbotryomycetes sp. JL221]